MRVFFILLNKQTASNQCKNYKKQNKSYKVFFDKILTFDKMINYNEKIL